MLIVLSYVLTLWQLLGIIGDVSIYSKGLALLVGLSVLDSTQKFLIFIGSI